MYIYIETYLYLYIYIHIHVYIYICVAIHTHWGFSTSQASMLSTWGEVQMPRSAKRNWTPWQSTRDPWKSARSNLRKEPLMRSGKRICWCFFFRVCHETRVPQILLVYHHVSYHDFGGIPHSIWCTIFEV